MSAERVALIPECVGCYARWLPADKERWQAWLTRYEPPDLSARLPQAWSRQLPISPFEEWHGLAAGVEAVDFDLVAADHEVGVDVGAVDAHVP